MTVWWSLSNKKNFTTDCECNREGSVNATCNEDGICHCKVGVEGERCLKCKPNRFAFPNCIGKNNELKIYFQNHIRRYIFFQTDCECDPNGSTSLQCQSDGKCDCKTGFFGKRCSSIFKPKSKSIFFIFIQPWLFFQTDKILGFFSRETHLSHFCFFQFFPLQIVWRFNPITFLDKSKFICQFMRSWTVQKFRYFCFLYNFQYLENFPYFITRAKVSGT